MVQFRGRLSCILPPLASLELLAAEYIRETNISNCIYNLLMVTCSLDALKKSWRRKDMRIKRKNLRCCNKIYTVERRQESKRSRWWNSWLWLCTYLLARIALTLILSPATIGCFRKVNFQGFSLVIWNFESSAFLSVSFELFEK